MCAGTGGTQEWGRQCAAMGIEKVFLLHVKVAVEQVQDIRIPPSIR